ncbi:hypothetical protein QP162_08105 [Sphingomonas aurantiaca]|uniref:hypothetical protein n=1 Tax=Sphingomonas aurantiaca TaxID=185949 RepID=UPI002FE0B203
MALGALAETFGLEDSDLGREPPARVGDWIDWILRGHTAADGRMTVRTSGSTGRPKPCDHAIADLLDEAAFLATQIPGRRRVVALVPAHHLYGIIWTALLPRRSAWRSSCGRSAPRSISRPETSSSLCPTSGARCSG